MVHLLQQVVIWCSRLSNLGGVAIPLHNKKNYVQTKTTDFFKRAPMGGKRVKKVQQKLTKYFSMKPKKARPGATAPRHHRRRHRTHQHHPPVAAASHSITSPPSMPHGLQPSFPLGETDLRWITPIRVGLKPTVNGLGPALFK